MTNSETNVAPEAEATPTATAQKSANKPTKTSASEKTSKPAKKKAPARRAKKPRTLADLCEQYVEHLEDEGKSPGTVFSYTAELRLACKLLGRDTKLAAITPEQMQAFYDSDAVTKLRSGRAKAPASIAKSRRVIRLALCYAAMAGWIERIPLPPSEATH